MMYERFGGRPINPARVESGNAIPVIGTGDVLAALVDLSDTELEHMTIADKIYTCMIEVKYKNNDLKLASWLKEAELVNGGYSILSAKEYDIYMKAYQKAFQLYGQDTANDTLLDYGCVLTPDIFESKKSFNEALNDFARTIRNHFGNSSFYNNKDNANYVARSYMMAKKMCENSQFTDITDIYACDMDVVEHTYGYDSSNIILLADTQVVQLNDSYGEDCDTDQDGINDNVEAHTPEEVDITNFLKEYCKYNKYTPEETADMIAKNSKVVMYNYSSNPVLPDSDFDGRDDLRDGRKLDNEYNSTNETDNYSNIKIKFNQDYRYFFMESTQYYEELAEMGLILSNMASKKKNNNNIYVNKKWTNNNSGEHYTANNINDFMWYIGMDQIQNHMEENVPYIIGQHDVIALLGKVNNLERNVITLVIGENENYKDILAANYDGSLGSGSGEDIHHQGYDYHAQQIYEQLVNYDNNQIADRWKKSYWIVGYGTGGSIANLVAKKFIDYKHVNTNVYCYTYQAPGTINRNNIPSGKKVHNTKYYSIFNHINTDDPLIYLEGDNFDRYGRDKRVAAGYSNNFYDRRTFGDSLLYGNNSNSISRFLMNYNINDNNDGMVSGFSLTEDISKVIDNFKTWVYSLLFRIQLESQVIDAANSNGELEEGLTAKNINNKYGNAIDTAKDAKYQKKVVENNGEIAPKLEVTSRETVKVGAILKYLDELAVWYINHVATYGSQLKGKRDYYNDATKVAKAYFDERVTKNEEDPPTYRIKDIFKDIDLKMINDKQKGGSGDEGRLGYKYDIFEDYAEDYETDKEKLYGKFTGDDCSGFILGVIRLTSKGDLGKSGIAGDAGLDLVDTGTSTIRTNSNFEKSMLNLGFHKYYYKDNEKIWKHKYIDSGAVVDKETTEVKGIGFLQPGDMLVCEGHVEFYNGFTYSVIYNDMSARTIEAKKQSGISSISRDERLKPGINNNGKDTKDNGRAYGTFSWGRVEDEYPVEAAGDGNEKNTNFYFTFNQTTKMFELHYSSSSHGQTTYKTIWRK